MNDAGAHPAITAVVVTWNGAHLLPDCLSSLRHQTAADLMRVLVVDNASTDDTSAVLATQFPDVEVIRSATNTGFAGGVALAMAHVRSDHVLLLNNDARLDPGGAAALLATMVRPGNERVAAVTATIMLDGWFRAGPASGPAPVGAHDDGRTRWLPVPEGTADAVQLVNSTGNLMTRSGRGVDRDWLAVDGTQAGTGEVFGFCGGAALLRREAVEAVGGFDPDLFLYYEDTDLSWRLRAAGWTVVHEPAAVAVHRHAASTGTGSPTFRYYNTRNSLVVALRYAPWSTVLWSIARQTAGALAAWLRHGPTAVGRARFRGLRDALVSSLGALQVRRRTRRSSTAR